VWGTVAVRQKGARKVTSNVLHLSHCMVVLGQPALTGASAAGGRFVHVLTAEGSSRSEACWQ
jgi:hypothetical protein